MFGRKTQEITKLRRRVERVTEQRDWARSEKETSRTVSAIVAAKFADNHTFGWDENARLLDEVADWSSESVHLAERLGRALRACIRYRHENSKQAAQIRRLLDDLDKGRMYADRALLAAVPTPETERLRRRVRELEELVQAQENRLAQYQAASERMDRLAVTA